MLWIVLQVICGGSEATGSNLTVKILAIPQSSNLFTLSIFVVPYLIYSTVLGLLGT